MESSRNSSRIGLVTAALLVALAHALSAEIKAATVNIDKLLIRCEAAKKELSALKAQRDSYLIERNTQQKKLTKLASKIKVLYAKLKTKPYLRLREQSSTISKIS